MQWHQGDFNSLSAQQWYSVLQLRAAVFVVEQDCVYQDIDGLDLNPECIHLLALNEDFQVCAYARILPAGTPYPEVSIGRVVVSANGRGSGLGHRLMQRACRAAQVVTKQRISLSAQSHLQGFYAQHGFVATGAEYLEDGIPHIKMVR
ncbi:GNAT family N-acetyltransferase [Motilimonas pumila]|uniref:GNAT family N-acetyltransferase n=1 Tax=Motilimonas pumila TaxID=2303987 RepID=A0A418YFD9_9GAMM|nr:GNAT family N-acetyltransferase [Motilimonas pumila]RJG47953.1 GNAT family N-acetyltransferase [Motilimonas pumila]